MIRVHAERLALALTAWLGLAAPGYGQGFAWSAGGTVVAAKFESKAGATSERLSGALLGLEGRVVRDRLLLDVRYLQGTAALVGGGLRSRDVAEAEALVGVRLARWAVLKTGAHIRTLITPQQSERWAFWEVRARGEAALASPTLRSYVELSGALAGSVNTGERFSRGSGVEAGLLLTPRSAPIWGQLGYRLDRGSLDSGARLATVQGLVFTAGVGRR